MIAHGWPKPHASRVLLGGFLAFLGAASRSSNTALAMASRRYGVVTPYAGWRQCEGLTELKQAACYISAYMRLFLLAYSLFDDL